MSIEHEHYDNQGNYWTDNKPNPVDAHPIHERQNQEGIQGIPSEPMKQNEYQSKFDQLLYLVGEADKGVTDAKKLVEKAESKKYRAEKALENFVSHTFIR